ncbi:MAG TPA: hypothetical protein VGF53_15510 [Pseudolabrys sp.]
MTRRHRRAPSGAKIKEFLTTYKSKEARARSSHRIAIVMLVIAVVLFAGTLGALYAAVKYPVG